MRNPAAPDCLKGKALIFGANGQDGSYLRECCEKRGMEALGISRAGPWLRADVADYTQVESIIREQRPEYIFHLAANSTTRHDSLFENHQTISTGTLNILEAVKRHAPSCRVFLAGSGLQFVNTGRPIVESDPFEAGSPYAVARIQSVHAARYYRRLGLQVYTGYLYHHESPRRGPNHVSQIVAGAARRIAAGSMEVLELGDVSVEKEWTFAEDVAEGMLALVGQTGVFEANIGSGIAHPISDWLEFCFRQVNRSWRDHVRLREGFRAEYPRLVCDPGRIQSLGWRPRVGMEELAALMMDAA